MKHRRETHQTFVEGCFACRIGGIGFGSIPGGSKVGAINLTSEKDFAKGMDGYKKAKGNGLQPNAPTVRAVKEAEARHEAKSLLTEAVARG